MITEDSSVSRGTCSNSKALKLCTWASFVLRGLFELALLLLFKQYESDCPCDGGSAFSCSVGSGTTKWAGADASAFGFRATRAAATPTGTAAGAIGIRKLTVILTFRQIFCCNRAGGRLQQRMNAFAKECWFLAKVDQQRIALKLLKLINVNSSTRFCGISCRNLMRWTHCV